MSKILVVDDDPNILKLCADFFSRDGHQVMTAVRGDQVAVLMEMEKPDLVLLDYQMPEENGLSILKKLQKNEKSLPVVLFSGFVTAELEKEAYAAGAIEVIIKGTSMAELQRQVYKILSTKDRVLNAVPAAAEDKIMVVDDEAFIRQFLGDFFKSKGFKVIAAQNGEEALKLFRTEKPNMILLDMTMPGMSGIETLKKIREINPEVGVVMATAIQDDRVIQEALSLGAYAYVLKPFDLKYLELVVLTRLTLSV